MTSCGMRKLAATVALVLATGPVLAHPLSDAIAAEGGMICFSRTYNAAWLKAHPGQTVREVKLAITDTTTFRLSLLGARKPLYVYGSCGWEEMAGNMNIPTFKPTAGVWCDMMKDVTGSWSEEVGGFPIDWGNGRTIELHLDDYLVAWRSYDVRRYATRPSLHAADRILRLNRVPPSACRVLVTKFAPEDIL